MLILPTIGLGSVGPYVKRLQMNLNGLSLNYNGFVINGIFDIKTKNAVQNFQDRFKLKRDGIVGPVTWNFLIGNVKVIQRQLIIRGYNPGYPDGWFGAFTTNTVRRFQINNKLNQEGIVNPRTRQRLFNPFPRDDFEYRPSSNALSSLNPHVPVLAQKFLDLTDRKSVV